MISLAKSKCQQPTSIPSCVFPGWRPTSPPIVRGAVYFPEFQFSNSIKSVAPALCPGFGYADLEGVADGSEIAPGRIHVP